MSELVIRPATRPDLGAVAAIYAHHVQHGIATFDTVPPSEDDWSASWRSVGSAGLPFLVGCLGSDVVGYAYAAPYRSRPAYRHTVEDSVYLAPEHIGQGHGRSLLAALLSDLTAAHVRQVIAVIAVPSDRAVDHDATAAAVPSAAPASLATHRAAGFEVVGRLVEVGHKHGRWLDTLLLQRTLIST